jgi:hypothetical protein
MIIVCFVWIGFVSAISFMESWLKFRAPGITLPLGLSIGRLIFRMMNKVEWAFFLIISFIILLTALSLSPRMLTGWIIIGGLLIIQSAWLLPKLDKRAIAVIEKKDPMPSKLHFWYVGSELLKVILLACEGWHLLLLSY